MHCATCLLVINYCHIYASVKAIEFKLYFYKSPKLLSRECMFNFNPRGENFRALEQNILKFRTFEMVLILFYVEEIKSIALRTIKVTDKHRKSYQNIEERLPDGTTKIYKKLWALLVSEGILSKEEKEDVERIIDYRNNIAHSIGELVFDLNVDSYSKSFVEISGIKYEYGIIERLK